jgi:ElaB/YqjD/DUF883 family membrane-anchored ribosome-binding protein
MSGRPADTSLTERASARGAEMAGAARRSGERVAERAGEAKEQATRMGRHAREEAREAAHRAGSAVSGLADSTIDTASHAYRTAAGTTSRAAQRLTDSAVDAGRQASDVTRRLMDFAKEQPLVAAGFGLALGAAIGALLPRTRAEERTIGSMGDEIRSRAEEAMERGKEQVKAAADRIGDQVKEAASTGEAAAAGSSERHEPMPESQDAPSIAPYQEQPVSTEPRERVSQVLREGEPRTSV